MKIEIVQEAAASLADYARISTAYEVEEIVQSESDAHGGHALSTLHLDIPYWKNHDAIKGEGPSTWTNRFDLSNWALLAAYGDGRRFGGAAVAPARETLPSEQPDDLAILWDIRVSPEARGRGIGSALFRTAEAWARSKNFRRLQVETQNINASACRFYRVHGCTIGRINRFAYPEFPDEIQILWHKDLESGVSI